MLKKRTTLVFTYFFSLLFILMFYGLVKAEATIDLSVSKTDTLEGQSRATVSCSYEEEGETHSCTPILTERDYYDRTEYIYSFYKDTASAVAKETMWKLKDIEIEDSSPIIYVDGVSAFDDPSPKCVKNYYNGYKSSCPGYISKDGNINYFCTCDGSGNGLRIAKFSYRDEEGNYAERYRYYYYVVTTYVNVNVEGGGKELHVDGNKIRENYSLTCNKTFYDGKVVDCFNLESNPLNLFTLNQKISYAGYSSLFGDTGNVKSHYIVMPKDFDSTGYKRPVKVEYGENFHWSGDTVTLIYTPDSCVGNKVIKRDCPIPTEDNWRLPANDDLSSNRTVHLSLKFNVSGVSVGSGE